MIQRRWSGRLTRVALCGALLSGVSLFAGEGMWTFDNPPAEAAAAEVRLHADAAVAGSRAALLRAAERRRIGVVRQPARAAADQSPRGARAAAEELHARSTTTSRDGFYARHAGAGDEVAGSRSQRAGVDGERDGPRAGGGEAARRRRSEEFAARKAAIAAIERESQQKTGLRSDVVTLYQGGEYWLYRYKKYTDVRLVFAPEQQIAFFGGDPGQLHVSALRPRHGAVPRVRERQADRQQGLSEVEPEGRGGRRAGVRRRASRDPRSRLDTLAQLEAMRDCADAAHAQAS